MSKKIKAGVIGAGMIGYKHIDGFLENEECEVSAIVDTSDERLKECADKYDVAGRYTDYKEMLAQDDIDVISIAAPNALHKEIAVAALESGKNVYCEKPIAMNYGEACEIMAAIKKSGKKFMVGQNFRFIHETQVIKQMVDKGELGDIYYGRASIFRQNCIPKFGTWFTLKNLSGGGALIDLGVHFLDLILYLVGSFDAEAVSGKIFDLFGKRGIGKGSWGMSDTEDAVEPFDVDDNGFAMIKLKGGKVVILEATWHIYRPPNQSVSIAGTEGGAGIYPFQVQKRDGNDVSIIEEDELNKIEVPIKTNRFSYFIDCVLNDTEPIVKVEESAKVQRILDAIYESSATGKEVLIKD